MIQGETLVQDCVFCDGFEKKMGQGTTEFFRTYPKLKALGQVLWISENFILLPDIAPISGDHLLLITQAHYPSFASVPKEIIPEAEEIIRKILEKMQLLHPDAEIVIFEHGVGMIDGSVVQCGTCNRTDHAHLHIVPIVSKNGSSIVNQLAQRISADYNLIPKTSLPLPSLRIQEVTKNSPYLLLWSNLCSVTYLLVQDSLACLIPSQLLRKHLCIQAMGIDPSQSEYWDWRNFALLFRDQAEETVENTLRSWSLVFDE